MLMRRASFMTMPPEFPLPGPSGPRYGGRGEGRGITLYTGTQDSLFATHPAMAAYSATGAAGFGRMLNGAVGRSTVSQPTTQRPTAEQLKSGFSTARSVHQRPTTSTTTLNAPRPGSALAAAMAAKPVKLELPETRFSQGASPTFTAGGTFETKPAPSPPLPSLDSFQSSSKDFLSGLKSGLPPGEDPAPAKSEELGTSTAGLKGNGKKRLGTGRPAPGGGWKKVKAEGPTRNGL